MLSCLNCCLFLEACCRPHMICKFCIVCGNESPVTHALLYVDRTKDLASYCCRLSHNSTTMSGTGTVPGTGKNSKRAPKTPTTGAVTATALKTPTATPASAPPAVPASAPTAAPASTARAARALRARAAPNAEQKPVESIPRTEALWEWRAMCACALCGRCLVVDVWESLWRCVCIVL